MNGDAEVKEIKEDGSTDTSKEDEAAKKLHKFMFNIADGGTVNVRKRNVWFDKPNKKLFGWPQTSEIRTRLV